MMKKRRSKRTELSTVSILYGFALNFFMRGERERVPAVLYRDFSTAGMNDKVLYKSKGTASCADEVRRLTETGLERSNRLNAEPDNVRAGLARLVLTVVKLVKCLMERQAVRRIDKGKLTEEQIQRMGETFMELDETLEKLKKEFDLEDEDLNLNLGPLGDVI